MQTFGQEVKSKSEFPSERITKLRYNLIKEELDEFGEAVKNKDLKEVADSLTDILYVTYGAGHAKDGRQEVVGRTDKRNRREPRRTSARIQSRTKDPSICQEI